MKLSPQQQLAVEISEAGSNAFITGMAGTGKSTVTASIVGRSRNGVDLCATTGIAALNLQSQFRERTGLHVRTHTIYRFAGIMIGPSPGQSFEDYFAYLGANMTRSRRAAYRRITTAHTVIIDEVSMLPGRLLDYLDFHFRRIRGVDAPFGGVQIIAVGDFLQLPPVAKSGRYDWAFQSESWQRANFCRCYLTQIFRQNEPEFITALNEFRVGRVRGITAEILRSKVARFPDRNIPRLFTHNVQVDKWNAYQLGTIDEHPERTFTADTKGPDHQVEYLIENLVTPPELHLKISARVMFTANLTSEDGELIAANGECGTIIDMDDAQIVVRKDTGAEIHVDRFVWRFDPQDEDSATFSQFPLRLAYSLTIHKSQGLTLDRALIDIRAAREPGQAYVALSRLRSLSGLYLKDFFAGVFVSPQAIEFYRQLEEHNALAGAA